MNKICCLTLLFLIPFYFASYGKLITIKGEVTFATTDQYVYIFCGNTPATSVFYKTTLSNNAFVFNINIQHNLKDTVLFAYIFLSNNKALTLSTYTEQIRLQKIKTFKFIIDSSNIKLTWNPKTKELMILGGEFNKQQEYFLTVEKEYMNRINDLNSRTDQESKDFLAELQNINDYRIINTVHLIMRFSSSLLSLEYLRGLARLPVPGFTYHYRARIDSAFKSMSPALRQKQAFIDYYKAFRDQVAKSIPKTPNVFPAARFENKDGLQLKLSELVPDKKYLLLEFWATWCGPCVQQQPMLEKLAAECKRSNIMIAGIATDKKSEAWKRFRNNRKAAYPDFWLTERDQQKCLDELSITAIPRYLLIESATGRIIEHEVPFDKIESVIGKYK